MEGYLDVARALEAGIGEAVATCGTAMTPAHARLLHRFTEKAVVNFDQDEAGQKAARKSLDILVEEGLAVHVVELPEGDDPDTFLKAFGAEAYRERIAQAPPYMDWLIRRAASQNDTRTPAGKAAYLDALLPSLVAIESAVERAAWLPAVVERGGLDEGAAREELRRAMGGRPAPARVVPPDSGPRAPRPAALQPAEKVLLALVLREAEGVGGALQELADADLTGLRSAELLRAAQVLARKGERVTASSLGREVQSEESQRLLTEIAVLEPSHGGRDAHEVRTGDEVLALGGADLGDPAPALQGRGRQFEPALPGAAQPETADRGPVPFHSGERLKKHEEREIPWRCRSRKNTTKYGSSSPWARRRVTSSTRR